MTDPSPAPSSQRILWVEDRRDDYRAFMDVLRDTGEDIEEAGDVAEALRHLNTSMASTERSFDTIILDMQIPIGEGLESRYLKDSAYNGHHVLDHVQAHLPEDERPRVICFTNFADLLQETIEEYEFARPVKKHIYLTDFLDIVQDRRPLRADQ